MDYMTICVTDNKTRRECENVVIEVTVARGETVAALRSHEAELQRLEQRFEALKRRGLC